MNPVPTDPLLHYGHSNSVNQEHNEREEECYRVEGQGCSRRDARETSIARADGEQGCDQSEEGETASYRTKRPKTGSDFDSYRVVIKGKRTNRVQD